MLLRLFSRPGKIPALCCTALFCFHFSASAAWWKGNLHTHSLWSDGDDYPEAIAEWYKTNGYHFLAFSDHNILLEGERWVALTNGNRAQSALDKYRARFGAAWVEQRAVGGTQYVRLKTLEEFRGLFEETQRFLLIPAEEITDKFKTHPVHINGINIAEFLKPQGGSNVLDVLQRNVNAVLEQRRRTGRPMFPHINHPNFGWGITAEELMRVEGERFFEVYNGHPAVNNEGDLYHASTGRIWDLLLTFRLAQLDLEPMFGLAVDDGHSYHLMSPTNSNPGRGWVVVRSPDLSAASVIAALEAGDFYSSSGVRLRDIRAASDSLAIEIDAEPGATYTTQYIGTRVGFDARSEPAARPAGTIAPVTRQYSGQIGEVLAEVAGTAPKYTFRGDEIYVRAKVISSKLKKNPYRSGEAEVAWVQPVLPGRIVNQ
ncbi:MAG: hypothetical protein L0Y58_13650 [Verrucomicrobia subdivision 3 bacterium]|nr:hypothetical protein [Limisphaerales bacterium]